MSKTLFITTIYKPQTGGIELCLYNIIRRLPKEKVVVLAQKQKGDKAFDCKQNYLIYRRNLESKRIKPRWLLSPVFALKIALKEKVKCVQAAYGFGSYLAAWWLKKILGLPYFVWAYGLDILAMQKHFWMRYLIRRIFRGASGGVANSNFTKKEMAKLGLPPSKIIVVYPGVDSNFFRLRLDTKKVREKYHLPQGKQILLSVSRLVARKGFDMVLGALPRILKKFPNTLYVIGGKGPDEARLKKIVARDSRLKRAVQFIGFVEDQDLPFLYNLADIFLMPSRFIQEKGDVEGFGMVFLEAGACGLPVVGGNSGGVPEAIQDGKTGFLVDPRNPQDLAEKVIKLLGDEKLRQKMGEAGKSWAREMFNWEKIVKNFQFSNSNLQFHPVK